MKDLHKEEGLMNLVQSTRALQRMKDEQEAELERVRLQLRDALRDARHEREERLRKEYLVEQLKDQSLMLHEHIAKLQSRWRWGVSSFLLYILASFAYLWFGAGGH